MTVEVDAAPRWDRWVARRLARDVVAVSGPEAEPYLQGQLSQDVAGMAVGHARDALLLEPDGKLCSLVRVTRTGDDRFVLDVDAGFGEAVEARLRRFRLRTRVDIEPVDWPCVALRGPGTSVPPPAAALPAAGREAERWVLSVDWNGLSGVDVLGPGADDLDLDDFEWVGEADWEVARIEAGVPAMGRELDNRTIAAEAGLVERTVSFTKGCYTGQELVARLDARGNRVARHLCGLLGPAGVVREAGPQGALEVGAELFDPGSDRPDKSVGRCTSAAWSPRREQQVGLGYVHRSVGVPGQIAVGSPDGVTVGVLALPFR